ncbi:uncharacterized protein BO95DRAFT_140393 [Aspergillus brunneoviolaceus CBS 621.78]|uniref:Uncharacterized protein n=1 Tax=Aspergillus brunneoviolaceus CBS 621.78 TaxID=1450534 RepID=A0ACD1G835_9EURO|nr:hypothetical protein BO95DRAFT_140393 [Aspergillus brunneoviolaceus CBS 621.78]RAH45411.1 hypothetical protein BO95DRAFT_140393 [Aspergillus brunneoviolaceus CBS 621.78]
MYSTHMRGSPLGTDGEPTDGDPKLKKKAGHPLFFRFLVRPHHRKSLVTNWSRRVTGSGKDARSSRPRNVGFAASQSVSLSCFPPLPPSYVVCFLLPLCVFCFLELYFSFLASESSFTISPITSNSN